MGKELKGSVSAEFKIMGAAGKIDVDYDLSVFSHPSAQYDHELCRLACKLVTAGYDDLTEDPSAEAVSGFPWTQYGLKTVLDAMGFDHQEIQPKAERDEVSYFIASRDIELETGTFRLVVAAFIGSYKKTWFSNFDPYGVDRVANGGKGYAGDEEKGLIHLGFADARDFVHGRISAFIKRNPSDLPIKLLLTGHSRGAATANLLGAKVLANGGFGDGVDIDADNVYTYGFATPNYADGKKLDLNDARFKRIFNIVSPEDFVTEVMPKAIGFGRYGTTYSILGQDNASLTDYAREKAAMRPYFDKYRIGKPYVSYKKGNRDVQKVAKAMAASMPDLDAFYHKKMRECFHDYTPFEYYKYTLCGYVGGNDSPEDQQNINRAMKLMLGSAFDLIGTSSSYRSLSKFFVFKEGIGGATGGKLGAQYFGDAHAIVTYLAYLMSMTEEQLKQNTER